METSVVTTSSEVDSKVGNTCAPQAATDAKHAPQNEPANNLNTDKELSWEKIAAEIAEGDEYDQVQESVEETAKSTESGAVSAPDIQTEEVTSNVQEKTSADTSKEEISITEADSSDQVGEACTATVEETVLAPESNEGNKGGDGSTQVINEAGELIEITELKTNAESHVTETIDGMEYTVIEAEDAETNEIIAEHLAHGTPGETIIISTEEPHEGEDEGAKSADDSYIEEIYILENKDSEASSVDDPTEEPPEEPEPPKPKKPRGRRPISDIPLHVLGRDISKPLEGVSNGGRVMPKPRLGVKVPYRNLTSQIVSKEEIEREIMDRFKTKQEQSANSSDNVFARKLTQNLAKKLITAEKQGKSPAVAPGSSRSSEASSSTSDSKKILKLAGIKNDSDLLAILEGDDGEENDSGKEEVEEKQETEREIALRQLRELPNSSGEEDNVSSKTPTRSSRKRSEKKVLVDVEPQLKAGMVVKTYTRKRKSIDMEPMPQPNKSPSVSVKSEESGTNVYVTKSSRIIKKKVIWDPAESPNKSPGKSPKGQEAAIIKQTLTKLMEKKTDPKNLKKEEEAPEKKLPLLIQKKQVIEKKSPPSPVAKKVVKPTVSTPSKKPKRLSEVDRLLMDEGAVNMLYEVKNEDSDRGKKKNKSVISLDKAHRDLMNRTNVIKNDLQQTTAENQKTLRKKDVALSPKKEAATPSGVAKKKPKEATKGSTNSPPASPSYTVAEVSRIIRRHSSSSFSTDGEDDDENDNVARSTRKRSTSSVESPKKKLRKDTKKETAKSSNSVQNPKVNNSDKMDESKEYGSYESFTAFKNNKLASIVLNHTASNGYFTDVVLKELISCIKELGTDNDCQVLSLNSSNGTNIFCLGIDYTSLYNEDEIARKKKATEMSNLVKEFLRCLLNFPKVLVAAIQGECVGLGVTMLPLFDMVIASDTSTFTSRYGTLGCIPEAGFLLAPPYLSNHGLASELFYTSQVIKADDAFKRGLVTKLCWPEKYHEELKNLLDAVGQQSKQSIVFTKKQLRHNMQQTTDASLNSSAKNLIENWISPECQEQFLKVKSEDGK